MRRAARLGAQLGEAEGEVGQVALRVEYQGGDAVQQRLLQQVHGEAGLVFAVSGAGALGVRDCFPLLADIAVV